MPIPNDFPFAAYQHLNILVNAHDESVRETKSKPTDLYLDFAAAHNTILWRFRGVADSDEAYCAANSTPNIAGDFDKRYVEERELFKFFASFVSTIEVLCYCSFSIAAMVDPTHFQLSTEIERRAVRPSRTRAKFSRCFGTETIADRLSAMLTTYADANGMRNALSHRGSPPRHIFVGDPAGDRTEWGSFKIDSKTTTTLRPWLAQHTEAVIVGLCEFAENVLGGAARARSHCQGKS